MGLMESLPIILSTIGVSPLNNLASFFALLGIERAGNWWLKTTPIYVENATRQVNNLISSVSFFNRSPNQNTKKAETAELILNQVSCKNPYQNS